MNYEVSDRHLDRESREIMREMDLIPRKSKYSEPFNPKEKAQASFRESNRASENAKRLR